jgi:hypothetical protein
MNMRQGEITPWQAAGLGLSNASEDDAAPRKSDSLLNCAPIALKIMTK